MKNSRSHLMKICLGFLLVTGLSVGQRAHAAGLPAQVVPGSGCKCAPQSVVHAAGIPDGSELDKLASRLRFDEDNNLVDPEGVMPKIAEILSRPGAHARITVTHANAISATELRGQISAMNKALKAAGAKHKLNIGTHALSR